LATHHPVQRRESEAVECAFALLGQARNEGALTEQMTLPFLHGGLGLQNTSEPEGQAAYLATAAATHDAMQNGPEEFRPFQWPRGQQLQPKWAALHDGAGDLWRQEGREVDESSIGTIRATQRDYSRHASEACAAALFASFDVATEEGKGARVRLLSCTCRPAFAWLDTFPLTRDLDLKSGEFQTGLRHRLGTNVLPPSAPSVQYGCGVTLRDRDVEHGMRCPALAAQTPLRHDTLKRDFAPCLALGRHRLVA
jgi:hypothetical protein